ncbi:PP2C family protein-serine/threonine phosphatase [Cyanobium sp. N5-Cardenillas]|uniref:PP2C family protein-serine/threonine phosphatase n=1 Tax=Cyanobium sp. N5-Cardenillas TaxID=2823720 RepID=UPI0020CCE997|nr:SpoIIE family protein phosphatase [Cyanobium sp. N5-Cardenillas]MCP9786655.1 SpoIIE family protein phosphatase [Cyanobium sp. N5-Cardenillas]
MEGPTAPISILLVDDDRVHSRILEVRLRAQGYRIAVADSGERALAQARLCSPTVILCDWLMDGMNGLDVCRAFKAEPALASAHFILLTSRSRVEDRVEGLDCGADDFLSKPVDPEELLARVRSGIRLHQANERLKLLAEELRQQKLRLDQELEEAASYVKSLLPEAIGGAVRADSRFEPCNELGGDSFDFFWLDDDHFVVYLADGSGHGLAAAFPSISVHNQLRSRSLPVDLRDPAAVLQTLNAGFPMERHQGRYLTLWYGVYQPSSRTLRFASAGHPPAMLWSRTGAFPYRWLKGQGMAVGLFDDTTYGNESLEVGEGACLLVYSDGLYEVPRPDGAMGTLPEFMQLVEQCRGLLADDDGLDRLLSQIHDATDNVPFTDDYSVIRALLS